jgi:hypothetical protein
MRRVAVTKGAAALPACLLLLSSLVARPALPGDRAKEGNQSVGRRIDWRIPATIGDFSLLCSLSIFELLNEPVMCVVISFFSNNPCREMPRTVI